MITCHGCSLTNYKWKCWPDYLKWFVDTDVYNYGISGNANETIARSVVETALRLKPSHIYIMWTGPDRYEIVRNDKEESQVVKTKQTHRIYDKHFQWHIWAGGHWDEKLDRLYKNEFNDSRQNQVRNIERVLYVQNFLSSLGIDYTMMQMNQYSIQHDSWCDAYSRLYDQVDWSKWVWYDRKKGLLEYQLELFPEYVYEGDWHPAPFVHYEWLRNIVLKTKDDCPPEVKLQIMEEKH